MTGASELHPLRPLLQVDEPFVAGWLSTLDRILQQLDAQSPDRIKNKRREFCDLRTEQGFLEWRAEIVVAVKIGRAGLSFAFGDSSMPNPDLVIDQCNLGVEVTGKTPEGVIHLYDEIEAALRDTPNSSVHLVFSRYPVRVNREHRDSIVQAVTTAARKAETSREGAAFSETVDDPKNAGTVVIGIQVLPVPRLGTGHRVTWETQAGDLSVPLSSVEHAVFAIGGEPAKRRQAESMPTLLAVDVTRLGAGWIRPPHVWAQMLRAGMPADFPFAGLAVITPKLDDEDTEIGLAVSSNATAEARRSVESFAEAMGLTPIP